MTTNFTIDGPAQAPVLVLANSLAATQSMWDAQLAVLRQRWRVLRFDYAGHGDTGFAGSAASSMDDIARELLLALDRRQIDRFSFLGLSLGGMLGLNLAARWPHRVDRLIAANCRYYQNDTLRQQWDQRIAAVTQGGMEAIAGPTMERWLTPAFREAQVETTAAVRAMICSTSRAGYAAAAAAVRDFDGRPGLASTACPVLLISAAQDLAAPSEHMAELAQALGAQHIDLAPCAHLSCVEQPGEFTQAVTAFLA